MKLPRWLVVCLIAVMVALVFAAAGWWWVSWPDRTARQFIGLLRESRYHEAAQLIDVLPQARNPLNSVDYDRRVLRTEEFLRQPAGLADLFEGRRRYVAPSCEFTVERGRLARFQWDEHAPRIEIGLPQPAR